jgi:hypothetical protein
MHAGHNVLRALFLHRKLLMGMLPFIALVPIILVQALKVADLVAVQNAVRRDWEISYGYSTGSEKPAYLPEFLDSAALDFFERRYDWTHGYDGTGPVHTRNRDYVYFERFRAFFRSPIRDITVYDFEGFEGDLGAALLRMGNLRRVELVSAQGTESDWELLCTRLRALPNLPYRPPALSLPCHAWIIFSSAITWRSKRYRPRIELRSLWPCPRCKLFSQKDPQRRVFSPMRLLLSRET